jgi:glutathione synthase/RimK-type ligase-like ATP-grasp enzyme
MILLWGVEEDGPLAAARAALGRRGAQLFFLDQRRASETEIELCTGADVEGEIRLGGERCDLAKVTGVYVRGDDSRLLATGAATDETLARHAQSLDETVAAFLDATLARVVNPFEAMATNGSKPYQLALIRAQGFSTPDTLIATEPAAVMEFLARHGELVYKSVSGVRSVVSRLSPDRLERLGDIRWCPTQFQEYVTGRDYRVHVVNDAIFACEIVSEADDYRYAARAGEEVELKATAIPPLLAERCRALAAALGLVVAGIDLRLTPSGEWFCFEVNPSPAFTYYESATGLPIADAIAALLMGD